MALIDQSNVYIQKTLLQARIDPDLVLTVLQLKTDKDSDPRKDCNCCCSNSAYEIEKTIHIFEKRIYKFTYWSECLTYDKMIGEVTHIEADPNYPESGYVEVKAYLTEEDIERGVYANIKRIPIANIQDAVDITPTKSPLEGDDYRFMLLGISATKVRSLIINLKMINDNEMDEAVKEVSLIVGHKYKVCYNNDGTLNQLDGTLTGMLEVSKDVLADNYDPNAGFVRESCSCCAKDCPYPEYNKYYLSDNPCEECPINCVEEEISFYNNTYARDQFLSLPEHLIADVLLTFDVSTDDDTEPVYKKILLSQIRNVCPAYLYEDPASTNLELEAVDSTIFTTSKNARILAIKNGEYDSWESADIKAVDVFDLYPNSYIPTILDLSTDGKYTVFAEFVDDTRTCKTIDYIKETTTIVQKVDNFIAKFNAWAIANFNHDGDYTKPLIEASVVYPEEETPIIHIKFNYYNLNTTSNVGSVFRLLDPAFVDSFYTNVIQKSMNSLAISINDYSVYDNGVLNIENMQSYITDILARLLTDFQNKSYINSKTYNLNDSDVAILNDTEYNINYDIYFPTSGDKDDFEEKADLLNSLLSFSIITGSNIGFNAFRNNRVLVMEVRTHNVLGKYLNNINTNRRLAINQFTIGSFLDIFTKIDILSGTNPFSIVNGELNITYDPNSGTIADTDDVVFNDILKIIQRNSRTICHILCNLKNTKLYKNDNSTVQIIADDKIFNMEPIDTSYTSHDPEAFAKLAMAFKNVFTDIMNDTSMKMFDYSDSTEYNNSNIFNASATWKIADFGSLIIPFSINYII